MDFDESLLIAYQKKIIFEFQMYFEEFDFNDMKFCIIKRKFKTSKSAN